MKSNSVCYCCVCKFSAFPLEYKTNKCRRKDAPSSFSERRYILFKQKTLAYHLLHLCTKTLVQRLNLVTFVLVKCLYLNVWNYSLLQYISITKLLKLQSISTTSAVLLLLLFRIRQNRWVLSVFSSYLLQMLNVSFKNIYHVFLHFQNDHNFRYIQKRGDITFRFWCRHIYLYDHLSVA